MTWKVLIAHANGEEGLAEALADPLRDAGYEVAHQGTVLIGDSVVEEASKLLSLGGPVVLCASIKAIGTKWARRLVAAARCHKGVRLFVVQMDEEADVEAVSFDETIARHWQDPTKARADLVAALRRHYPLDQGAAEVKRTQTAEERYRELLLKSCDIVNLANLPEQDRHLTGRQSELALRRLYVPLHAWVEVRAGEDQPATNWTEIETARTARRRAEGPTAEGRKRERVKVGERLAAARRLVVLGDPGAGKTTLARWIATAYLLRLRSDPDWQAIPDVQTLPAEDLLPIVVRCRQLDEDALKGALDEILRHTLRRHELGTDDAEALVPLLLRSLDDGRALLLFDGLDEIPDPRVRARFCEHLEQIHRAHPQAPIVATSRIVGYREMGYRLGEGFEHLTLADLEAQEKDDFVRRWCALTELPERRDAAVSELIHDIHSSDRIEHLTGNPMLLTTLALVKRKVGRLPTRRADLYAEAVEVLLNWRSEVDTPIERREAIPQLAYVAYVMCDRGVQQLRRDELLALMAQMRTEYPHLHLVHGRSPEEFLRVIEARTGLVVEAGHVRHLGQIEPVYEFRHLTLQEYLAARALVDGYFPGRDPSRKLADDVAPLAGRTAVNPAGKFGTPDALVVESWREPLRLCTAICRDDDVDAALLAILNPLVGEPELNGRARAIQAALCLADEPNVSDSTATRIVTQLARSATHIDGDALAATGADIAVFVLAPSRWQLPLQTALREESLRRGSERRAPMGLLATALYGALPVVGEERVGAVLQLIQRLRGEGAGRALDASLCLMALAFEGELDIDGEGLTTLADALLKCLKSSSVPLCYAAVWALQGLFSENTLWRPDIDHIDTMQTVFDSQPDPEMMLHLASVIGASQSERLTQSALALVSHPNPVVRDEAISLLARGVDKEMREVLSRDFSANSPWVDPREPVSQERVRMAAEALELSLEEVRARYEALAPRFKLRLEWIHE
jgi:hypothetical protein